MGTIRLLLAFSVVIHHMTPVPMLLAGGTSAVRLFYIISGFFMALVLNEKYVGPHSTTLFYTNRVLRLFPPYYAALLLFVFASIAVSLLRGAPFLPNQLHVWASHWPNFSTLARVTLVVLQISLLGQDLFWTVSWRIPESQFDFFATGPAQTLIPGYYFLLNPPAWTISVELWFYFLAPWIVRRSWWAQGLLMSAGFLLLFALPWMGATRGFWYRQFIPTQLPFFICGSLAYAAYRTCRRRKWERLLRRTGQWGWVGCLILLGVFPYISEILREGLATIILTGSLAGIFHLFKRVPWDQYLGDLSYPVYLVHWNIQPLAVFAGMRLSGGGPAPGWVLCLLAIGLSLTAALVLNYCVERPIDRWRQRRVATLGQPS